LALTLFDEYADSYESALGTALAVTGEGGQYYATGRVRWLAECLQQLNACTRRVLDFGCGNGSNAPLLHEMLRAECVIGVDIAEKAVDVAQRRYGGRSISFFPLSAYVPDGDMDLVYCNGVFHHIRPADRIAAIDIVWRSLRVGGLFAFWENNPLNPGTRYVMHRCEFDWDALPVWLRQARKLLRGRGFAVVRTHSLFFFPRALQWLRPFEACLRWTPFGGQYQVLARKV
jgi:SAM-dependent methyltransferase